MEAGFNIFDHIRTGDINAVVAWMARSDAAAIRRVSEGTIARVELCYQSEKNLENLLHKLLALMQFKDMPLADVRKAAEKEKWMVLYYLKAYSVIFDSFFGALDLLKVRPHILNKRLSRFDAQVVIAAEERYCADSAALIARQALGWFEYMSCVYMDGMLVEEVSRYLAADTPQIRKIQYEAALNRVLTVHEKEILRESAVRKARSVANWIETVCNYGEDANSHLDHGLICYFDDLILQEISAAEAERYAQIAYRVWPK